MNSVAEWPVIVDETVPTARRIDIGVASYGNAAKLRATLASLTQRAACDYRIFVIHNPGGSDDMAARAVIQEFATTMAHIVPVWMPENVGYVGAVNWLLRNAETEYIAYTDNDVETLTEGWDSKLCAVLEANPEVGWVFPGSGHYGFDNGRYHECLWNAGYCWVLRRDAAKRIGERRPAADGSSGFDPTLGHHEEVDYMIRMRLDGWRIACVPEVNVLHHETATRGDEAVHKPGGRIHDGVVRWMNKWNRYFCGDDLAYSMTAYDPRALRYTDWPPCALYLERMVQYHFPNVNAAPRKVAVPGVGVMDAIEVLKPEGPYVGRAI